MSLFKKKLSTDTIDTSSISTRPIRKNNRILTDKELVDISIKMIDDYVESTKTPPPIDNNFVQWLRDCKEHTDNGGSIKDFKNQTIQKTFINNLK